MIGWTTEEDPSERDVGVLADGVLRFGRSEAVGGNSRPLACFLREHDQVVAGASGRIEFDRLFISYLWVAEHRRGSGLGQLALLRIEDAARERGGREALIETLSDRNAALYRRVGYRSIADIERYVGPFTKHVMIKPLVDSRADVSVSTNGIQSRLREQGAAPSQLRRIAQLQALFEGEASCAAAALLGSFAKGSGNRLSDLDVLVFTNRGNAASLLAAADRVLATEEVLDAYSGGPGGSRCFRKYVYLDFSSCELLVVDVDAPFRLFRPYLALWDPTGYLAGREVPGAAPQHESFEPYPHGDAGLIWELVDCIKWIKSGRVGLVKDYLGRLGAKLQSCDEPVAEAAKAADDVRLREAGTDDALRLSVLAIQVFLDTYATNGIRDALAREVLSTYTQSGFADAVSAPGNRIVVAEREGHLIGFAQVTIGATHELAPNGVQSELLRLYVQERFTVQGVGTRLLAAAEDTAARAGSSVLWLTPWVHNHRALAFYARRGYADYGLCYFRFEGETHENRLLAKVIGPA
jgi:diamine N-acetyltransferase